MTDADDRYRRVETSVRRRDRPTTPSASDALGGSSWGAVFLLLGLRRPIREYGLTVGEGGCYKTNSTLIEAMAPRSRLLIIEGNGQRRPSFCKE